MTFAQLCLARSQFFACPTPEKPTLKMNNPQTITAYTLMPTTSHKTEKRAIKKASEKSPKPYNMQQYQFRFSVEHQTDRGIDRRNAERFCN